MKTAYHSLKIDSDGVHVVAPTVLNETPSQRAILQDRVALLAVERKELKRADYSVSEDVEVLDGDTPREHCVNAGWLRVVKDFSYNIVAKAVVQGIVPVEYLTYIQHATPKDGGLAWWGQFVFRANADDNYTVAFVDPKSKLLIVFGEVKHAEASKVIASF